MSGTILIVILSLFLYTSHQQDWSQIILDTPDAPNCRQHLETLTRVPHNFAFNQENNQATVEYVKQQLENAGFTTTVETFPMYINLPVERNLSIVETQWYASLTETPIEGDPSNITDALPTWLGYTGDGENVQGPLVYVNYGLDVDYDYLSEVVGIDVRDKIVIVRYGRSYRGTKVYEAQIRGAKGILIYSDPYDDGYRIGDVYPKGGLRPENGVQRGSSKYEVFCPGSATPEQLEYCKQNASNVLPRIPALPLSYKDAEVLLRSLTNASNPVTITWQGSLPFHYHYGGSGPTISMTVKSDWKIVNGINVKGVLEGQDKNKIVMMGNHRDAWVFGAVDPSSGTTAMLEVIRAFGRVKEVKNDWKPRRTIEFHSWDAEEWGLGGSIDYGQKNAANITRNVVAYLNLDVAVSGKNPSLSIAATPCLTQFVRSSAITGRVIDPKTKRPLNQVWDNSVGSLGFGSDYVVFASHLGIISLDGGFNSNDYGVYHSIYDNFHWMTTVADTDFSYHVATAQLYALMVYHLANDIVLPLNYVDYHTTLVDFRNQLAAMTGNLTLNYQKLDDALEGLGWGSAQALKDYQTIVRNTGAVSQGALAEINTRLSMAERLVLSPGLPNRTWFKNVLVGPGIHSGYSAVFFPGVIDTLYDYNRNKGSLSQVQDQIDIVADRIWKLADLLQGTAPRPGPPEPDDYTTLIIIACLVFSSLLIIILYFAIAEFRNRRRGFKRYDRVGMARE